MNTTALAIIGGAAVLGFILYSNKNKTVPVASSTSTAPPAGGGDGGGLPSASDVYKTLGGLGGGSNNNPGGLTNSDFGNGGGEDGLGSLVSGLSMSVPQEEKKFFSHKTPFQFSSARA